MLRLATIGIVVKDAKASAKWYREKLGLTVRHSGDHWVTVASARCPVDIHLCEGFYPLDPGNTGILFYTKDIKAEHRRLAAKGVKFTEKPKKEPWGWFAMFADPDGNEFQLMEE